ncbi:putative Phage regulatory protein Rha [Hyella patelloides LEGE 07179]|uniref:Putative Phage regulatory protein Rha n=1 Tax=Hyella patelloides LEGE 07179 TaxID=945734 RepID=A0A563W1Y8_9CYAN|nr:Rha family transcriptional regulator [Hyella patelloides]VEP17686.1 putative Phage regulatory protein Rha [Hyella patelloides LEGE 07179]
MSTLSINEKKGVLVVDSRLLAQELGVQHRSFYQKLILKYREEIEEDWGVLRFEIAKVSKGTRGGRPEKYVLLTEQQSYLILTYSKNTTEARQCKRNLVKAFDEAKKLIEKVIPAQAIEIEKLKLQLQVAEAQKGAAIAQERLLAQSRVLALVDPGLPAIVLGNPNAVVTRTEVIERTVLINEQGRSRVSYEGLSKTKLAKKYGMKRAKDLVDWLKSIGFEDVLKPGLIATSCQYIPIEEIAELDRLWAAHRGLRQILIGE